MNEPIDNPSAFPNAEKAYGTYRVTGDMSLRDYFAAQAMQGIVDRVLFDQKFEDTFVADQSTEEGRRKQAGKLNQFCAFLAYDMADCMLAERAKTS